MPFTHPGPPGPAGNAWRSATPRRHARGDHVAKSILLFVTNRLSISIASTCPILPMRPLAPHAGGQPLASCAAPQHCCCSFSTRSGRQERLWAIRRRWIDCRCPQELRTGLRRLLTRWSRGQVLFAGSTTQMRAGGTASRWMCPGPLWTAPCHGGETHGWALAAQPQPAPSPAAPAAPAAPQVPSGATPPQGSAEVRRRPPGRAPAGKVWLDGAFVDRPTAKRARSPTTEITLKVRPMGKAPKGKTWDGVAGCWKDTGNTGCFKRKALAPTVDPNSLPKPRQRPRRR